MWIVPDGPWQQHTEALLPTPRQVYSQPGTSPQPSDGRGAFERQSSATWFSATSAVLEKPVGRHARGTLFSLGQME